MPLVFATFQNIPKRYPPPFSWIERYTMGRASGVIAFGRTVFETVSVKPKIAFICLGPLDVLDYGANEIMPRLLGITRTSAND